MTPVRTVVPSTIVRWPTVTPATSVMALSGPGGRIPISTPASRARGRSAWAEAVTRSRAAAERRRKRPGERYLFSIP